MRIYLAKIFRSAAAKVPDSWVKVLANKKAGVAMRIELYNAAEKKS